MFESGPQVDCCVKDIGGEHDVEGAELEFLDVQWVFNVQHRVANRGKAFELGARLLQQHARDIRETVFRSDCRQPLQNASGGAARAGAELEKAHGVPARHVSNRVSNEFADQSVVESSRRRVAIKPFGID